MMQSKVKPITPFIYMKSEHLFRGSMGSEEKDTQAHIHFFWLHRQFLYQDWEDCQKPGLSEFEMQSFL